MSLFLPVELWLLVLKDLEPKKLIQLRMINPFFRKIIDLNLNYFYIRYLKRYSHLILNSDLLKSPVSIESFEKLNTLLYIDDFRNHGCSPYFVKKMQNERLTLSEAKLVFKLYNDYGIEYYAGIRCYRMNTKKIAMMLELKDASFPIYFAHKYVNEYPVTREKLDLLKDLKDKGLSDFFCGKMTYGFTEEQRQRVYNIKKNNNVAWYNAIYLVENS